MSKELGSNITRKITSAGMGFSTALIRKLIPEEGTTYHLYNLSGKATATKRGESTFGPWVGLTGDFLAEFTDTNGDLKSFRAPLCFPPDPFCGIVVGTIEGADKATVVQFAVEVHVKWANTVIGYEYFVVPVVELQPSDDIKALSDKFTDRPALPQVPKTKTKK